MGTRATIEITDAFGESFYVYRGHDGFPESVIPDVQRAIDLLAQRKFGSPEASFLTTVLLGQQYDESKNTPNYEITAAWHGDESFKYACHYNKEKKIYSVVIIN